ncbi:MAG TPA: TetR/AcrR family transcriptional regulator [Actinomycetota bacterium]|nr:TetR/AcrR family transcriptional regulator [Actinomycetota bacterium]
MGNRDAGRRSKHPAGTDSSEGDTRSARKRRVIMEAATTAFLRNGYLGTSMDEIAALAAVSKQTVYKHFADKQRLFTDIILATSDQVVGELVQTATLALQDTDDVEKDLRELARQLITAICQPQVLRLRRLIIGEADRFPELGRTYWERGFERGLATLADKLQRLAERGLLHLDDPQLAAHQFAGMILWVPVNRVMFCGEAAPLTPAEIDRYADAGARTFLKAYGRA